MTALRNILDQWSAITPKSKNKYEGFLNLSSNELQHPLLDELVHAFRSKLESRDFSDYFYWPGLKQYLATEFDILESNIALFPGSDDAIQQLFHWFATSKSLILQSPNYGAYVYHATLHRIKIQESRLGPSCLDNLMRRIKNTRNSVVVITNPNGITGEALDVEEINELAIQTGKFGHILVIDEAYASFNRISHLRLLNEFEHVVIIRSFSKSHGMAGARLAAVFARREVIQSLSSLSFACNVSSVASKFYIFISQNEEKLKEIYSDLKRSQLDLQRFLALNFPGWLLTDSVANFVMLQLPSPMIADRIAAKLRSNGIILKSFADEEGFQNCLRVTLTFNAYLEQFYKALLE